MVLYKQLQTKAKEFEYNEIINLNIAGFNEELAVILKKYKNIKDKPQNEIGSELLKNIKMLMKDINEFKTEMHIDKGQNFKRLMTLDDKLSKISVKLKEILKQKTLSIKKI